MGEANEMSSMTKKDKTKDSKKPKAMTNAQLIELVQSNCVHRRREFVFEGGRNISKCLDCGKNLKKVETEIVTQGKPEDA